MGNSSEDSSSCPVDPAARAAWLEKAQAAPHPLLPSTTPSPHQPPPRIRKTRPLASDREISSIPRGAADAGINLPTLRPEAANPHQKASYPIPSASSSSSSSSAESKNWVYPSEKQFYDALLRKKYSPSPSTIPAIIPLHNAVNERAWSLILSDWEYRSPSARARNNPCGGPRLRSFSGDSSKLTPRARLYGLMGYEPPFDRHDWVVERCGGETIEYVIDFYKGRGGGLSFFLDVRPKLNSWAGWKLRIGKFLGL